MIHLVQLSDILGSTIGLYLQGPRTPQQVKARGYGFTDDPAAAWPFPSEAKAAAKARVVSRHMSWPDGIASAVPAPQPTTV